MKAIHLIDYGRPDLVCKCVDVNDVGSAGPGEVVVAIEASAINPADLLMFKGLYPGPSDFPAAIGIEGAGHVIEIGAGVSDLKIGDKVISLGRANWVERVRDDASRFIKMPEALDIRQAAMLKANPPSAELMLEDYVTLQSGDWVIQNAANSAVGRHIIRLAARRGIKTVNIVRRAELVPELIELGADLVLVDGKNLGERVRAQIGNDATMPLAIDAIGGSACLDLADCLSDGGTIVNYGFLSGDPCQLTPTHTIVHGISLTGFWLAGFFQSAPRPKIEAMYTKMANFFIDGVLDVPIEAEYSLDQIAEAMAHSDRESRSGKILLTA
jgi:trans-2-enoyl-CoA reductase